LLSRRELTTAELRERLLDREYPEDRVDGVIERLTNDRTLDDRRAATAIARTQALVKGRGRLRVGRELTARGVPRDLAREVVDEVFADVSENDILERALRRRLPSGRITSHEQFRRLYQYLARLGFAPAQVLALLKKCSKVDVEP
jgi:regulatory protein